MNGVNFVEIGIGLVALAALGFFLYTRMKALHLDSKDAIIADLKKHFGQGATTQVPPPATDPAVTSMLGQILATAQATHAATLAPVSVTLVPTTVTEKLLGQPIPPGPNPLARTDTPAAPPAPPAASKSLHFSASDQVWKNGAIDSKSPVIVTIDADLTGNGFVMSMTRVWDDAALSVTGPGTLSGNSNDYGYVVPPTQGPVTMYVTGDRQAVYGFAYRSGQ